MDNVKSIAAAGEKAKALQAALAQIEKQFGKGTIMRLGEGEAIEDIQVVSTGSLGLDVALGVGGLPRGRVIEIYGPESSGKTTLTLQVIAEMQKMAGTCAFVDAEHALDVQYAQKLGVNLQDLLISQPDTGEQALEIVDSLVRSGAVDLIVIDSVAALTPKAVSLLFYWILLELLSGFLELRQSKEDQQLYCTFQHLSDEKLLREVC